MRTQRDPRVSRFLDSIDIEGIGLSTITVWEILNGISRLDHGGRRRNLSNRFQELVEVQFEERVIDWTRADAYACASIMEHKRRRGESLDDHFPDACLAATAICRGLSIVTRNTREFRNTGVDTVDPWIA